jgi:putative oxidoreductase
MRRRCLPLAALSLLAGCVQPAFDKTVVYTLDVSGIPDVKTVGVRGDDRPLSWDSDRALTPVVKDSLYRVTVTYHTGYLKTEVKFTVNGDFELKEGGNRRVAFGPRDTTAYQARFNVRP